VIFNNSFIRPPGTVVPGGLMFYYGRLFFLSFFSSRDLRAPWADRRETLPRDRTWAMFHNLRPTFRGALPTKKNLVAKNVQNSARFRTTLDFDREYLRNELTTKL